MGAYDDYLSAVVHRFWDYAEREFGDRPEFFDRSERSPSRPPVFVVGAAEHNLLYPPGALLADRERRPILAVLAGAVRLAGGQEHEAVPAGRYLPARQEHPRRQVRDRTNGTECSDRKPFPAVAPDTPPTRPSTSAPGSWRAASAPEPSGGCQRVPAGTSESAAAEPERGGGDFCIVCRARRTGRPSRGQEHVFRGPCAFCLTTFSRGSGSSWARCLECPHWPSHRAQDASHRPAGQIRPPTPGTALSRAYKPFKNSRL